MLRTKLGIDCIIFDLFGVVVAFDDHLVYDRLSQWCPTPHAAAVTMRDLVSDPQLIRGRTSLEELHGKLMKEVNLTCSFDEFSMLWSTPYTEPMPGMRELLRHLASSRKLVLLSNVDRYYWPTAQACVPELRLFHARVLSFEQGTAKPEALAFRRAVEVAGVPANRCLFVDDKPENILAATGAGLLSHLFTSTVGLKEHLRQVGVLAG